LEYLDLADYLLIADAVLGIPAEHAIQLLDALNAPEFEPWTLVDAAWTSKPRSAVNTGNRNGG
jgi:hypothetical protein